MRPTRVLALAGLSVYLLAPVTVAEIESEFHVGYSTDYIFRGGPLGGDLYEFGLDFAGSGDLQGIGALDWSAGIWYASFEPVPKLGPKRNNQELDIYYELIKNPKNHKPAFEEAAKILVFIPKDQGTSTPLWLISPKSKSLQLSGVPYLKLHSPDFQIF